MFRVADLKTLLREPLLHFLGAGLGLFLLFALVSSEREGRGQMTITVDRAALLEYLQFQTRRFDAASAEARLDSLTAEQRDRLIDSYVREEALYREALSLGLGQNDYMIKRRLVQSMEYVAAGFATAGLVLSDDDVRNFYRNNLDRYSVGPTVTFTHVFFSNDVHGRDTAEVLAAEKLAELNAEGAPFEAAPAHGDRFLYAVNYLEREPGFVAGHFGLEMTAALFALEPDGEVWKGPLESAYGFHIVLLTAVASRRVPELDEIAEAVRYDAERAAVNAERESAVDAIIDTYGVRLAFPQAADKG